MAMVWPTNRNLPPSPRDRLITALLTLAQNDLSHNTISKHEEDEDAEELGQGLSQMAPHTGPPKVWVRRNSILLRDLVVDNRTVLSVWHWRRRGEVLGGSVGVSHFGVAAVVWLLNAHFKEGSCLRMDFLKE
jgi:hypothetical protein